MHKPFVVVSQHFPSIFFCVRVRVGVIIFFFVFCFLQALELLLDLLLAASAQATGQSIAPAGRCRLPTRLLRCYTPRHHRFTAHLTVTGALLARWLASAGAQAALLSYNNNNNNPVTVTVVAI